MSALTASAVKARAAGIGFDLCGIARAERHPRLARLAEWIAQGRAGEMTYLSHHRSAGRRRAFAAASRVGAGVRV